jgi:hypothetical protein
MMAYVGKLFAVFQLPPSSKPHDGSLMGGGMSALVPGWYTRKAFTGDSRALSKYSTVQFFENHGAMAIKA